MIVLFIFVGLCLKDDAILLRFDFLEDGRVESFEVVERRELPALAAILEHGAALAAKQLQHAFEIDRLGGVHVERTHRVALEVRREIFEYGRELLVAAAGAEGLHAIDGFDPSFARQLHRRGFRRFVTGAAHAEASVPCPGRQAACPARMRACATRRRPASMNSNMLFIDLS